MYVLRKSKNNIFNDFHNTNKINMIIERVMKVDKKICLKRSSSFKDSFRKLSKFCCSAYKGRSKQDIIFDKNSSIYLLPNLRTQDIDSIEDWKIAEKLYKINRES